jgi:predicted RNase H-like HicB family nuclease
VQNAAYGRKRDEEHVVLVRATWDAEAQVYVADSDDVPGLITEAASLDALVAKLQSLIPELLELNESELPAEVPFQLLTRQSASQRARD